MSDNKEKVFIKKEVMKTEGFKRLLNSVDDNSKEEFLKELETMSKKWQSVYDLLYSSFSDSENLNKLKSEWEKTYSKN